MQWIFRRKNLRWKLISFEVKTKTDSKQEQKSAEADPDGSLAWRTSRFDERYLVVSGQTQGFRCFEEKMPYFGG